MSVRVLEIKVSAGSFRPEVTTSGLTLNIAPAPFSWMKESGTVPQSSITFEPSDAGKFVYATLAKVGTQYLYQLTVQDPGVQKPVGIGPTGQSTELYPFLSGKILANGFDLEVRHFILAAIPGGGNVVSTS